MISALHQILKGAAGMQRGAGAAEVLSVAPAQDQPWPQTAAASSSEASPRSQCSSFEGEGLFAVDDAPFTAGGLAMESTRTISGLHNLGELLSGMING